MSDQVDNRPVFVIVMGCDGAGKSAWKRANYDLLPPHYIDQDSLAGGLGDWNDQKNREYTKSLVEAEINSYMQRRMDFGIESTFSGLPGVAMMNRTIEAGYRVEGIYIGTNAPDIHIRRIAYRIESNTGHSIDPERIPSRYKWSLSNLRRNFIRFDQLQIIDNSAEDEVKHQPQVIVQCVVEKGEIIQMILREQMARWCAKLLDRIEQDQ